MTKVVWNNRYSGSDLPDDLGRWARVGYLEHKSLDPFKREQIAWINKINGKYTAYVYLGSGKFSNVFDTEEQAKEYCEQVINDFYNDYLEKYINYLESENKKMLIGKIKNLLFDYEVESAKPYPYDDKKVAQRITNYLKTKENADK